MSDYTFKVAGVGTQPFVTNMPVDKFRRQRLYDYFYNEGVILPGYNSFNRRNLKKRDLMVLTRDWSIRFQFNDKMYLLKVYRGAVWDGASVPGFVTHGRLSKRGQHIDEAALVHDILFSGQLLPFKDCNNIFVGMIDESGLSNKVSTALYEFGVNSAVGKRIYEKMVEDHWLDNFYEFEEA